MQHGILKGGCKANCVSMLLVATPILSDQSSYPYKGDLSETLWNDHLKEQRQGLKIKKEGAIQFHLSQLWKWIKFKS